MANAINRFFELIEDAQLHIPFSAQWAVIIDFPDNLSLNLPDISNLEGSNWEAAGANIFFDTDGSPRSIIFADDGIGCILADEVNQIGDNYSVSDATIGDDGTTGGIIPGIYSKSREGFAQKKLNIKFRETSVSFADFVIRPWIIIASHYGRIADANNIIKSEINIVSFGKAGAPGSTRGDLEPGGFIDIRKQFTYFGCTPLSITDIKLTYDKDVAMGYEVGWAFDKYAIREEPRPLLDSAVAPGTQINPSTRQASPGTSRDDLRRQNRGPDRSQPRRGRVPLPRESPPLDRANPRASGG